MDTYNPYAQAYEMIQQNAYNNNAWSAQMAANNMNFQLDMANTAHQREVADLKAAGLNPILSAHGNGAAVGSGAMAQPDHNSTSALAGILQDMIASQTAIGVANAKAAGGGYSGGSGANNVSENTWSTDDPEVLTVDGVRDWSKKAKAWAATLPVSVRNVVMKGLNLLSTNAEYVAKGINHAGGKKFTQNIDEMTNKWVEDNIWNGIN